MANDLSFFDYKRAVLDASNVAHPDPSQAVLHDKNVTEFYRLSFYNRTSAEMEYQLLTMLANARDLPEQYKQRIDQYIEQGARFLQRDALIADNAAEAKKYTKKIAAFEQLRTPVQGPQLASVSEWQQSLDRFYEDMQDYMSTPWHVSKFIVLLSYINLYRLLTVFSRLAFKSFWTVASERHWIDAQDRLFGYPLQRAALDIPRDALNVLSVLLFLLRLTARFLVIFKHAMSQRPGEKEINVWDRVAREFSTAMVDIMNDGQWWWINLLTNYPTVFGITDPVANTLLIVTLVYDCSWLAIHWYRKERDWAAKEEELIRWKDQSGHMDDIAITDYQLVLLKDIQWEVRCKYAYSIVACLSIITSFILFLAAISAVVSTISLFVCVVGFAMYGSADEFGGWMRAEFGVIKLKDERDAIRAKFIKNFLQAFCSPVLVMGLMAFSWQVAALAAFGAFLIQYLPERWDFIGGRPPAPALPTRATEALPPPGGLAFAR